jgi:hypothetical protein
MFERAKTCGFHIKHHPPKSQVQVPVAALTLTRHMRAAVHFRTVAGPLRLKKAEEVRQVSRTRPQCPLGALRTPHRDLLFSNSEERHHMTFIALEALSPGLLSQSLRNVSRCPQTG